MKNARYWFALANSNEYFLGVYLVPISLPRKYEAAFEAGFTAGKAGRYYPKGWTKAGVRF